MRFIRLIALCAVVTLTAACASKFRTYDGPPVTSIVAQKANRKLYLLSNDTVLKSYDIALGFSPVGDKKVEGDGKTPEGSYVVDRFNPNSQYYLSVGVSYPNAQDQAEAKALGQSPGGDIFIHGQAGKNRGKPKDWTAGCMAVTDREISEIYSMVRAGTPIFIKP